MEKKLNYLELLGQQRELLTEAIGHVAEKDAGDLYLAAKLGRSLAICQSIIDADDPAAIPRNAMNWARSVLDVQRELEMGAALVADGDTEAGTRLLQGSLRRLHWLFESMTTVAERAL